MTNHSIRLISSAGRMSDSPARVEPPTRAPFRVAAVQHRWHRDPVEHAAALTEGVRVAAEEGALLVCLQELTLSRYFGVDPGGPQAAGVEPEGLPGGATHRFAARMAGETGIYVHASLYERAEGSDGLGYNTAMFLVRLRLAGRKILTNMDGIEWRRPKWSRPVRAWFYVNEWLGAWLSQRRWRDVTARTLSA